MPWAKECSYPVPKFGTFPRRKQSSKHPTKAAHSSVTVKMLNMAEDSMFESRIVEVLHTSPYVVEREGPTKLLKHLYIGNYTDAYHLERLRDLGITHVINCAAFTPCEDSPYDPEESGVIAYKQFHAHDTDNYDMLQHYTAAKVMIDDALERGGKALVHCAMGINRSGIICTAYIIDHMKVDLLQAVRWMKQRRGVVLCNRGFQRSLMQFARERGLLHPPAPPAEVTG